MIPNVASKIAIVIRYGTTTIFICPSIKVHLKKKKKLSIKLRSGTWAFLVSGCQNLWSFNVIIYIYYVYYYIYYLCYYYYVIKPIFDLCMFRMILLLLYESTL